MPDCEFNFGVVEQQNKALGFKSGWTFLCCHEDRLRDASVAIVGLNPGGQEDEGRYENQWATGVNAYYAEHWGPGEKSYDRLQEQIQRWHDLVGADPEATLCAQFVPFRTQNWESIEDPADRQNRKEEVLRFSRKLWAWVIATSPVRTFITMGKVPGTEIARLLGAEKFRRSFSTGWGSASLDLYLAPDGRRVIAMPHPSRFTLFGRANGASVEAEASFAEALSCQRRDSVRI